MSLKGQKTTTTSIDWDVFKSLVSKLERDGNYKYCLLIQHFAKNHKPQSFQNQGIALFFLYFSQVRGLSRTLK